jgi:hypothetical protein
MTLFIANAARTSNLTQSTYLEAVYSKASPNARDMSLKNRAFGESALNELHILWD